MTKIIVQISRQRGITICENCLKKIHQLYSYFIPSYKIINRNDQMSKTEKKKRKKKTRSSEKAKKTNFTHNLIEQKQSLQIVHKIQVTRRGKKQQIQSHKK